MTSDVITPEENEDEELARTPEAELAALKQRADTLGISYSHKIGLEALRARVNAAIIGDADPKDEEPEETEVKLTPAQARQKMRQDLRREKLRLIRCRITNHNPNKQAWNGEVIAIRNKFIGTVKKFIPFDEVNSESYHLPKVLVDELRNRQFLVLKEKRDRKTRQPYIEQRWVNEYTIEELPPLTQEELQKLALEQKTSME